ncbi:MAG: carbohydrate kinase family protein [Proteobacteria bacterium]|nr:carbohydrate kinase family protein [Pseudomonadota bacterium]
MIRTTTAKKSVLICGSAAYDSILLFPDRFKAHILPEKIHMLNVSFLVSEMRREFGGCATNIAYNLKLLGDHAYPMATVGHDFGPYRESLTRKGVPQDYLKVIDSEFTAQAFITTDLDDNQITAFHPGAMQHAHVNRVADAAGIGLGVVAPDGRQAMIEHAGQFAAAGIPFIFDPGQGLPMFGGEELRRFIEQATWVAVNDYEWQVLQHKTGWSERDIVSRVKALVVTHGADGSLIHTQTERFDIPSAKPQAVIDPTGCGDAYRAGLIHGILRGEDWATTGRIASLMGAIKIGSRGPQNHQFTREQFERWYRESFRQERTS